MTRCRFSLFLAGCVLSVLCVFGSGQSHTSAALDLSQSWTGTQTFTVPIVLNGASSGSVTLQVPAAAGSTVITFPATSGTVALSSSTATTYTFTEGACSGAATGADVLCADSTLHAFKSSLNNGAFVALPQLAGDLGNTAASPQVTSTHLSAPLPLAQGGTGVQAAQGNGNKVQLSTGTTTNNHCVSFDGNGNTQDSGVTCPGSGTVDTGTGTNNFIPKFSSGPSGVITNSALSDDAVKILSTEPYAETEAAAPSGIASTDVLYADSTAHTWKMKNNNGSAQTIAALETTQTWTAIQRESGNIALLTGDFTSANASGLQVITGLSFTLPNAANNFGFECNIKYSQATPSANDQFGVASLTTAPTNLTADASPLFTNVSAVAYGDSGNISNTTPTAIITFTPAVTNVLGVTLRGTIETAGGGASTLQFYVTNGTAANVIVIKRGSYCRLF